MIHLLIPNTPNNMKSTILILAVSLLQGCTSSELKTDFDDDLKMFLITYQKSSSWINYSLTATLDQNGVVNTDEFTGALDSPRKTTKYTISAQELKEVRERLNDLSKISLSKEYGFDNEEEITDLPLRIIKYTTEQKADETSLYYPKENEMPQELNQFVTLIERLIR